MRSTKLFDKLSFRLVFSLTIITLFISIVGFAWTYDRLKYRAEEQLRERARVAASQFLATRAFVAESYQYDYSLHSVEKMVQFQHLDPRAAEKGVRELFTGDEAWFFKEIWFRGNSIRHAPDAFELKLLRHMGTSPNDDEAWGVDTLAGRNYFRYLVPINIEESCLVCHGSSSDLPFTREVPQYELGELAGALSLGIPMVTLEKNIKDETMAQIAMTSAMLFFSVIAIYWLVRQLVEVPLKRLTFATARIGKGNLDYPLPSFDAATEIQQLALQFDKMAARLKNYYQDLEDQVAERTAKLKLANETLQHQQTELQKANHSLAKANKLKSEFLATVSHELRTPLTSITAFVELLLEGVGGELTELQQEYLEDALRGSHRLMDSINAILDLAKIEAQKMGLSPTRFFIDDLVNDVKQRLQPIALKKGVSLNVKINTPGEELYADKGKVEQILVNLIGNGIKFTDKGGTVKITVTKEKEKEAILFAVMDSGVGIGEEEKKYIFEAFRQVDASSTRSHQGTGLGLAIAKSFVNLHGGRIWVESEVGLGSSFYFTIPLSIKAAEVAQYGQEKDLSG